VTEQLAAVKVAKLHPSKLKPADYEAQRFSISPPPGVTIEEVCEPIYWHHAAGALKPRNEITVVPEDFAYYAKLLVLEVGDNTARVVCVEYKKIEGDVQLDVTALPEGFGVEWVNNESKYTVRRKADKQVMASSFVTKEAAFKWLFDNRRTLTAPAMSIGEKTKKAS
jgi:hypothetical protein